MPKAALSYLTDKKGQKKAVVIPLAEYQELIEDLHDLAVIAERWDEPIISFTELKNRFPSSIS